MFDNMRNIISWLIIIFIAVLYIISVARVIMESDIKKRIEIKVSSIWSLIINVGLYIVWFHFIFIRNIGDAAFESQIKRIIFFIASDALFGFFIYLWEKNVIGRQIIGLEIVELDGIVRRSLQEHAVDYKSDDLAEDWKTVLRITGSKAVVRIKATYSNSRKLQIVFSNFNKLAECDSIFKDISEKINSAEKTYDLWDKANVILGTTLILGLFVFFIVMGMRI